MSNKVRFDVLVCNKGYASSREVAKRLIMAGDVLADGQIIDKPGTSVDINTEVTLKKKPPYVSRGGRKLKKAVDNFGIFVSGRVAADIGASTGG